DAPPPPPGQGPRPRPARRRRAGRPHPRRHRRDTAHLPRRPRTGALLRVLRLQGGRPGPGRHPRGPRRRPGRGLHAAAPGPRPRSPAGRSPAGRASLDVVPLGRSDRTQGRVDEMLRYTLMRLGIFVGCLVAVWGLVYSGLAPRGLGDSNGLWIILLAMVLSAPISFVALRKQRDIASEGIVRKV